MIKKSYWLLSSFFVLFLMLFAPNSVKAFDIPKADGYVLDQAGVLSGDQENKLEAKIAEMDKSTTAEVGVLIVKTLDGDDISQTSFDVGEKWGVGKKGKDNGVMILIAVEDRDWFIATGYGVEGVIPDAIAKRIGEKDFPNNFRKNDYYQGVMDVLIDIEGYIGGEVELWAEDDANSTSGNDLSGFQGAVLVILILFIIVKGFFLFTKTGFSWGRFFGINALIFFSSLMILGSIFGFVLTGLSVFIDLMVLAATLTGGKGGGSGKSGSNWTSSSGGFSSGGSSGGGSSFGGGSFGGGGAGGKW